MYRAAQDMVSYNQVAVPVTRDSLDQAGTWIRNLDSVAATTKTSACEAILKAVQDRNVSCYRNVIDCGSDTVPYPHYSPPPV